jgi:hypothetical protein
MFWDSRAEADTQRMGVLYFAHAEKGAVAGKDANHDGVIDYASKGPTPEEEELTAWIDKSLPNLFTGIRHTLLVRALVSEGLTLSTLSEAAELRGGFEVLVGMLKLEDHGMDLSRGESLRFVCALMKTSTPAAPAAPAVPAALPPSREAEQGEVAAHGMAGACREDIREPTRA